MASQTPEVVDIKLLLSRLWPLPAAGTPVADDIADAIALFFTNQVSEAQASALLMCLHFTGLDRRADVMAACAARMRKAAARVDPAPLRKIAAEKSLKRGQYSGGLCDIVGTGGDSHNTFNVSTASSIVASAFLRMAKHGNRASTSKSGSADLLANLKYPGEIDNETTDLVANLNYIEPATLPSIYSTTNYAFLFAPVFHPGMRFVAPIRKQLPWRTLFNLLGPLANPVDVLEDEPTDGSAKLPSPLEARVIGVARRELGPVFAEALRMTGARKAMVVCGSEDLDEISIAGPTYCWWIHEDATGSVVIDHFQLNPADFGVTAHPLSDVSPGKSPAENAATMTSILQNQRPVDDPLLSFVFINTAALMVVAGLPEDSTEGVTAPEVISERGPGGGRWKEGVRLARLAVSSGEARRQWKLFVEATNQITPTEVL
ncbi:anthranilate phosphoribosyltransferase [Ophiostoma piceae UAMH 11346]|uniref:Anthranilate phosphoribosyltransferase n=1 Tax=Ophiostoma piceae (strain UAMH 11346) TaxID=1262450 RepID=S3CAP4_OPHP1|nr:anthranilate phosphoribosyltransferase [Ophiostoma piceae UAMH 11346]